MRTDPLPYLVLLGLTILSVGGCSAATPAKQPPPGASAGGAGQTSTPAASSKADGLPEAWLLVGRPGEPGLHVVAAANGQDVMDLPAGSPRSMSMWDRVMTATSDGPGTIVRDMALGQQLDGPELRIDGQWRLPAVGLDPIPAGRSLDGSTIALVDGAYDPAAGTSRFAIVEHHLASAVSTAGDAPLRLLRIITLTGAFEYDTLSPDGRILYVVQHLDGKAGGHYQVRAVDVSTGVMRDAVIVDKTRPGETMAGSPVAQVRRPDGLVLTLYRGPEHPFIHALNSREAWAVCIDLPTRGMENAAASLDWGLAPSVDGSSVFAANASLGLAVDVDPAGLAVRRYASIGTTAAAPIVLAKFGHGDVGPVGRRVVASPDGKLLFAGGDNGVTVIRTVDLTVARGDLAGSSIEALGITPDGATLFALVRGSGEIVAVDASTGRRLGTVPGRGFDRLLAVAPW
jgi:hypothetical protein